VTLLVRLEHSLCGRKEEVELEMGVSQAGLFPVLSWGKEMVREERLPVERLQFL
jgi:hypothetical protein